MGWGGNSLEQPGKCLNVCYSSGPHRGLGQPPVPDPTQKGDKHNVLVFTSLI